MSIAEIIGHIKRLAVDYEQKYRVPPNYVKIPLWVSAAFQAVESMISAYTGEESNDVDRIAGLICCSTPSIERIEDIEVF